MFDFRLLSLSHLRRIAKYYNKHIQIKGVSKMSKEELIKNLELHLFINELGEIKLKDHTNMVVPKNPKNESETLKDDIRRTKKLVKSLERFNQVQKSKESEELLEFNKKMLDEFEEKLKNKKKVVKKVEKKESPKKLEKKEESEDIKSTRNLIKVLKKQYKKTGDKEIEKLIDMNEKMLVELLEGSGMEGGAKGYALHSVLVNKSLPYEEAFKEAQHIIKKKKFFHRETKNQYRFRNIPKQKFEPKSFRSKKINENLTLVLGKLKPEHMHLEGAGIFDWIKEKAGQAVGAVKNYFKPREDFNNLSKKTISEYGNIPIKQLYIMRAPVQSMLNNIINFVSLGKWNELKQKYNFDKLFHLSLVARLENGKNIIMEKNEVVNITPEFKFEKDAETLDIPFNGQLTINQILDTARKNVGDKTFFLYDAFKNNCQYFIKFLLEGQNLYSQKAKDFLFQDLEEIYKGLPSYVPKVMKGATTMGAIVNKILGKGKDKIIMNPDDFIKEHKHLIHLLRQFDDPKLLAEANDQAEELKKETGVDLVNKGRKGKGNVGSRMVEIAGGKDKLLTDLVHLANVVYSKVMPEEQKALNKFFKESEMLVGREGKTSSDLSQEYLISKYQPMIMDYVRRYTGRGKKQKIYH